MVSRVYSGSRRGCFTDSMEGGSRRVTSKASIVPRSIGALRIRILLFGVYHTIALIRKPQNPILIVKAATLLSSLLTKPV